MPLRELTVPVQMVFASVTPDGVVLDCMVATDVVAPGGVRIPDGVPFSLLIDARGAGRGSDRVMPMLQHWCSEDVVVDAVTFADNRTVLLRHDSDELVLEII